MASEITPSNEENLKRRSALLNQAMKILGIEYESIVIMARYTDENGKSGFDQHRRGHLSDAIGLAHQLVTRLDQEDLALMYVNLRQPPAPPAAQA